VFSFSYLIALELRSCSAGEIPIVNRFHRDAIRLQIGERKQFFFDNVVVESVQNLTRRLHSPRKEGHAPLIRRDKPWEQVTYFVCSSWRVIRDPLDHKFKCWYEDWQMHDTARLKENMSFHDPRYFPSRYLFAQSEDGIHWEKPELDVHTEGGHRTNIVLGDIGLLKGAIDGVDPGPTLDPTSWNRDLKIKEAIGSVHSGYVFLDPLEQDSEHRFKIMFNHRWPDLNRYEIASSPDGIHWKLWDKLPSFGPRDSRLGDVATISFDMDARTYVINTRHPFMGTTHSDPQAPVLPHFMSPYRPDDPERNNKRRIFQARSADLIHWSEPEPIVVPDDAVDNLDDNFYGMKQYDLGGMWVGFLDVFHNVSNTTDVQLLYSRNGRDFHRAGPVGPWLPTGGPGSWDQFMVNTYGGPVAVDDELYIYHGGARNHHDWWIMGKKEGLDVPEATDMSQVGYALGLARMKMDRFVSLSANQVREGLLITRALSNLGGRLIINAHCHAGGYVKVEAAHLDGTMIKGLERDACIPFSGDDTAHEIAWKAQSRLPEGWLKLHFYIRDAELYTFQVCQ